ncbi:MAG: guanine deaminase [Alphaproteobacteria bacterium]|nr:guanine deaminase [Alphaproteobacteria bacterium]
MTETSSKPILLTGRTLSFDGDPTVNPESVRYTEKGAVLLADGHIVWTGQAGDEPADLSAGAARHDYGDNLILPGFVDGHVHYPQIGVIASFGAQLLDWLEKYTFPEEARFSDPDYADRTAKLFLDLLLANGTTTAAVYCTVHPESADAFFAESSARNLRMIAGKILMDRNAPDSVRDTAQSGYDETKLLIEKWHGQGRNLYAVTPRFAPTSTPAQLEACGTLMSEFPDIYLQSHVSENTEEVKWVAELFSDARSYLDVYGRFGMLGARALYGHAIHMDDADLAQAAGTDTKFVHCPTSNLFIGSGLFRMQETRAAGVDVMLGCDVGGGTSLSPFATMKAAYEIAQFSGYSLTPEEAFWLSTSGGAETLSLGDRIGKLQPGYEADLVVLDVNSTPIIRQRMDRADSLRDMLFTQMILADDRAVRATYAAGGLVYRAPD